MRAKELLRKDKYNKEKRAEKIKQVERKETSQNSTNITECQLLTESNYCEAYSENSNELNIKCSSPLMDNTADPDDNSHLSFENSNIADRLKKTYRSSRAREQALRRKNTKLLKIIEEKNKIINKWKQKYHRLLQTTKNENCNIEKVKKIERSGPQAVRKRLLFAEALEQQLKERKKCFRDNKSRSIFAQCIAGKVLKKYKCMKMINHLVSSKTQTKHKTFKTLKLEKCRAKKVAIKKEIFERVKCFLEKDENSAIAPGVKDTVKKTK